MNVDSVAAVPIIYVPIIYVMPKELVVYEPSQYTAFLLLLASHLCIYRKYIFVNVKLHRCLFSFPL